MLKCTCKQASSCNEAYSLSRLFSPFSPDVFLNRAAFSKIRKEAFCVRKVTCLSTVTFSPPFIISLEINHFSVALVEPLALGRTDGPHTDSPLQYKTLQL